MAGSDDFKGEADVYFTTINGKEFIVISPAGNPSGMIMLDIEKFKADKFAKERNNNILKEFRDYLAGVEEKTGGYAKLKVDASGFVIRIADANGKNLTQLHRDSEYDKKTDTNKTNNALTYMYNYPVLEKEKGQGQGGFLTGQGPTAVKAGKAAQKKEPKIPA